MIRERYNSVPPKLYGLRKTHKLNISIRPIVSCLCAPSYNLSVFVHNILSMVNLTSEYSIKNSYEFVAFSKNVLLREGFSLFSLDVVSLFTNIPRELIIKLIRKRWCFIAAYTDMTKELFLEIIAFIHDSSYFQFNTEFYQQVDGTAMGNPASPSLANFVMTELIHQSLKKLRFMVEFIKLYVDDLILAIRPQNANELLSTFNDFHPRIQFTIEEEEDSALAFLDLKVIRDESGSLSTCWYMKPSNSGRVMNFKSETSRSYKVSTIKNLLHRVINLSAPQFHEENLNKIRDLLDMNSYPRTLVNKIINEYSPVNTSDAYREEEQTKRYFRFPYIPSLSYNVANTIKEKLPNYKLVFYNLKTVRSLFSGLKDLTPLNNRSNVIYKIPCLGCSSCYIGQTKQLLKTRIKQHKYDCDERFRDKENTTALAAHRFAEGHTFDFDSTTIVDYETNRRKRNLSEMIHIKLNDTVNYRTDAEDLSQVYSNLLARYREFHIP